MNNTLRITAHGLTVQNEISFRERDGWTLESMIANGTGFDLTFSKD